MRYSLEQIETFLTVMELGTISAAAARLNLAKSVVSKRISDFEAAVGAALFRRNAGRITPTEAAIRKLCEDRHVVVASPGYLAHHGTPQAPTDLRGHQIVGDAHLADLGLWRFRQGGRTVSPPVSGRLTMNNGEAMRDMAIGGLGLAMLPGFIVTPALKRGALVEVMPEAGTRALPIMAVWPPVAPMPAKLRAVVDHLAAELAGGAPWR